MRSLFSFLMALAVLGQDVDEQLSLLQTRATVMEEKSSSGFDFSMPDGTQFNFATSMSAKHVDGKFTMGKMIDGQWTATNQQCTDTPKCEGWGDVHFDTGKNWACGSGNDRTCSGNSRGYSRGNFFPWGVSNWAQDSAGDIDVHVYQCPWGGSPRQPGVENNLVSAAVVTMAGIRIGDITIVASTSFRAGRGSTDDTGDDTFVRVMIKGVEKDRWSAKGQLWQTRDTANTKTYDSNSLVGEVSVLVGEKHAWIWGGSCATSNDFQATFQVAPSVHARETSGYFERVTVTMRNPKIESIPNGTSACTNIMDEEFVRGRWGSNELPSAEAVALGGMRLEGNNGMVINPGNRAETLVFNRAELDSRCDGCYWGTLDLGGAAGKKLAGHSDTTASALVANCTNPYVPGAGGMPPLEDQCNDHGCSLAQGETLCGPLSDGPPEHAELYDDCLMDYCTTCNEAVLSTYMEIEREEEAEELLEERDAAVENAVCEGTCTDTDPCAQVLKVDLGEPSVNNLGGTGPGQGASEIRYARAGLYQGVDVDLVVTTDGAYTANEAQMNGAKKDMGRINVKSGTSVSLKFSLVASQTQDPVTVPKFAITVFDMDEGNKGKARNKITACDADGVYTVQGGELVTETVNGCSSASSSTPGNGDNSPKGLASLTADHLSRSATFSFLSTSEANIDLDIAKGGGARNLQFAIAPIVGCAV